MIYPTASDILRCVDQTLADASDIDMPRMAVKSALATSRHMIRHVDLRTSVEAEILRDDMVMTTALLGHTLDYIDKASVPELEPLTAGIRAVLATGTAAPGDSIEALQASVLVLREQVYGALAALQKLDTADRNQEAYKDLRQQFRSYMTAELAQEARMIIPAFLGKGPRR